MVNKSNIGEVTVEEKGFRITIKQKEEPAQNLIAAPIQAPTYVTAQPAIGPAVSSPATVAEKPKSPDSSASNAAENLLTIKSPMIGTFYRSSSPDKPAFVNVGDEIDAGKVVCIIEAMKLFNEIESEVKGKIVKVLVDDASPVEYDQPLFLVEPA